MGIRQAESSWPILKTRYFENMITRKNTRHEAATPVKSGHRRSQGQVSNAARLRALITLFDVPIREVARRSGYSRAYVQRCISRRDRLVGAPRFYLRVESSLADIVQRRRRAFFQIEATDSRDISNAVRSLQTARE
jgi:hypothetical protein